MERNVPEYVSASVPVPLTARVPWYKSTFPSYFGIFLFVGYYLKLSAPTIGYASVSVSLWGLLVAGLLCFGLYYYVPAMLGMQTGRNLYVVGTSTFGTTGGFLIPGILMGLLQVGWVAVDGTLASHFIMQGLNQTSRTLYSVIVIVWLYSLGWVAIKGLSYVSEFAKFMNWVPFVMMLIVLWTNRSGIPHYQPPQPDSLTGFLNALLITIGFFATAGAAGTDFGMNNAEQEGRCSGRADWGCCRRFDCRRHLGSFGRRLPGPQQRTAQLRLHRCHRQRGSVGAGHVLPLRCRLPGAYVLFRLHRCQQLQHHAA